MVVKLILLVDWNHRDWNDVQHAIKDCGWKVASLLLIIIMNLDHGPWAGQAWWEQLKAGAEEWYLSSDRTNTMTWFDNFLKDICQDIGEEYLEILMGC